MYLLAKVSIVERVLNLLKPLFADWGYFIVFGVAFLEHSFMLGLVIPGDAALLLGAFYAGQGQLNIALVIVLAVVGCMMGDNLGYLLGLKVGRPLLDRYGDFLRLREKVLLVEKYFEKHGGSTVFFARFVTFIGTLACPVAGMSKMKYRRFLLFDSAGAVIWGVGYGLLGYFFGNNFDLIEKILSYVGNTFLIIIIVIAVGAYIVHRVRKHRKLSEELDELAEESSVEVGSANK